MSETELKMIHLRFMLKDYYKGPNNHAQTPIFAEKVPTTCSYYSPKYTGKNQNNKLGKKSKNVKNSQPTHLFYTTHLFGTQSI